MEKIGFKLSTDRNGEMEVQHHSVEAEDPKLVAVLKIAREIHEQMDRQSKVITRHEPFRAEKLVKQLQKLYIKYYEPL